ncbi:MAG: DUF1361 domain-containing protein [Chitinophagales bacterium]|nr:DUF1361 domain-containing protein [Chitinophagales bacterium]
MLKTIRSKYFQEHYQITVLLIISSLYSIALELLRIYLSGHKNYFYFIWNLFLAWVPYLISMYLPITYYKLKIKIIAYFLLVIWFLFWPNSPYIITDLLHLNAKQNIPLWFDLCLILSFAWTGLMLGFTSLIEIQNLIRKRFNRVIAWTFSIVTILTGSLGIYIGRYVRLNTWDVVANPMRVYFDIAKNFNTHMMRTETLGMVILYGIFLLIGYLTIKIIIKIPDRMAL